MKQLGLIGYPVSYSLSPQMQQAAFDSLGIDASYVLWETPPSNLARKIASLRSSEVWGANVTIPYKEDVVLFLDECDSLAARIGAVNTIVNRNGRLSGYNTDAPGVIRALAEFASPPFHAAGKKAVILGTGGAARAAAVALIENGIEELALLGRSAARLAALIDILQPLASKAATDFSSSAPHVSGYLLASAEARTALSEADLLVNATPVGLKVEDSTPLLDVNLLPLKTLVMDMIYNPPVTPFLRAAQLHGCRILNGLAMLLYQGALSFEIWTGHPAPVEIMQAAIGLNKGEAYHA